MESETRPGPTVIEMKPTTIRTRDNLLAADLLKSGHRIESIERDENGRPIAWRFAIAKKEADAETGDKIEGMG